MAQSLLVAQMLDPADDAWFTYLGIRLRHPLRCAARMLLHPFSKGVHGYPG